MRCFARCSIAAIHPTAGAIWSRRRAAESRRSNSGRALLTIAHARSATPHVAGSPAPPQGTTTDGSLRAPAHQTATAAASPPGCQALLDYVLIRPRDLGRHGGRRNSGYAPRGATTWSLKLGLADDQDGDMSLGNSLKFPAQGRLRGFKTGRARRGNSRLGAHMTQRLRSLENGARRKRVAR